MKYTRALGETPKGTGDTEILRRAGAVLEAMIVNEEIFPDPLPSLEALQAAKDAYESRLAISSKTRGLQDISLKNEAKAALADTLQKLAFYVNTVADGHLPTLYASGFRITSPAIKGQVPYSPSWIKGGDGHLSGSVSVDFQKVNGNNVAYEYAYAVTDDLDGIPEWGDIIHTRTTRKNIIDGLIPRTVLHIRVRAVNANGVSEWTPPIKHIVR
ncbi:fibronectin type III domain-containing protein [Sphingobacterium gobiense]|nr:fibronectin type III domain-containing protein [Sphingobacterium gobiense]